MQETQSLDLDDDTQSPAVPTQPNPAYTQHVPPRNVGPHFYERIDID